jgi:arabinan endo-1,5-alpha-L-arabinosidase
LTELDPSTGIPKSTAASAILPIASRASGTTAIEAPFIVKWNNYYYLFVSWDKCCDGVNSTYKMVVGRAEKITGPYIDKENKAMTSGGGTILDQGDSRWKGPGHNGIMIDKDTVFCINHAYDANSSGAPIMMIRQLYWDNNWPTFTKPTISTLSKVFTTTRGKSSGKAHLFLQTSGKVNILLNNSNEIYSINGEKKVYLH